MDEFGVNKREKTYCSREETFAVNAGSPNVVLCP
jgi:hypothetical protein